MKRRWKILLGLSLVLGVCVVAAMWLYREGPGWNQSITLADGSVLRFRGVTVGTNHVQGSGLGRLVRRLPQSLQDSVARIAGGRLRVHSRRTMETNLLVWVEAAVPAGRANTRRESMITTAGGPVAGHGAHLALWMPTVWMPTGGTIMVAAEFPAWPRRARDLELVLVEWTRTGERQEAGRFRFPNPEVTDAPVWHAEPLPAMDSDGDIQVTLEAFVSGVGRMTSQGTRGDAARRVRKYRETQSDETPGAFVAFRVNSTDGEKRSWKVAKAWLSDATGNHLKATRWSGGEDGTLEFHPVLWPEEESWKLTMDLKRTGGFAADELLVFTNLDLPAMDETHNFDLTNTVQGLKTVLRSFVRKPDMTNNSWSSDDLSSVQFEHDYLDERTVVDLISVTPADGGEEIETGGAVWSDNWLQSSFQTLPKDVTALNLTYVIQKTRRVEFLVDPNWIEGTNQFEIELEVTQ
ncbi:MAG TPA: hypothetical protein VMS21_05280 [Methylomirabilota bacterium]|nr:hypothetical protein [Methylomirabilota bacterium]